MATGNVGGAQGSVTDLMLRLDPSRYESEAIFLTDGPAVDRMRQLNLPVTVIDEPDDRLAVRAIAAHLREREIDVLHAHMFRAELLGARAAHLAGTPAVVATVHSSRVRSADDIAALAAETPLIDHLIAPSEAIAAKIRREGRGGAPDQRHPERRGSRSVRVPSVFRGAGRRPRCRLAFRPMPS